jgi:hypothetical protein
MLSGRMKVVMDDGTEGEAGPGDVVRIEPGDDVCALKSVSPKRPLRVPEDGSSHGHPVS